MDSLTVSSTISLEYSSSKEPVERTVLDRYSLSIPVDVSIMLHNIVTHNFINPSVPLANIYTIDNGTPVRTNAVMANTSLHMFKVGRILIFKRR